MKKSDITKEKILNAAEIEFAQKGLYGARVDEIAERAGVNKRMLYAYFGNKEELYAIVLSIVYERLSKREELLLQEEKSPVDLIKDLISMYFDFLCNNPTFVKLILWENLNEAKFINSSDAIKYKGKAFKLAGEVLEKGKKDGIFKSEIDTEEMILSLNMFCFSYFSNIYTMSLLMNVNFELDVQKQKRLQHITDVIMSYILK